MPEASNPNLIFTGTTKPVTTAHRACENCRALKVRCQPAPVGSLTALRGECQRCANALRVCVFKEPIRTRAKRTDVRVRELEQEVKALSGLLMNGEWKNSPTGDHTGNADRVESDTIEQIVENGLIAKKRKRKSFTAPKDVNLDHPHARSQIDRLDKPQSSDPVSTGILTIGEATKLFDFYVNHMLPQRPLVAFPEGTSSASLRLQKPILFLAVVAAAAGGFDEQLGLRLSQIIQRVYVDNIMMRADKSLELIQAILVTTNWCYPPDAFEELNIYQHLHMAATMALELGLDGAYVTAESRESEESIESRRTLLACYLCCASLSLGFHRSKMVHFTPYMGDSIDLLECSLYAASTDRCFTAWVKLQRIMDLSAASLRLNTPGNGISLAESHVQLILNNCSKQLQDWETALPSSIMNESLSINYRYFTCILHEVGLHDDFDTEDFNPPYSIGKFRSKHLEGTTNDTCFTPAHISSIMTCLSSAQSLLDIFLCMSIRSLQFSPVVVHIRAAYAIFLLVKIHASASTPKGNLNQVLDPEATKLRYYLPRSKLKFIEVASHGCRLASKFSNIVTKLQECFDTHQAGPRLDGGEDKEFDLIHPFRHLSLQKDKDTIFSRCEEPKSRQHASFPSQELPSESSRPLMPDDSQEGLASVRFSNNSHPLNPADFVTYSDGGNLTALQEEAMTTTYPPLADCLPSSWASERPDDCLVTDGLAFETEFLEPFLPWMGPSSQPTPTDDWRFS